MEWLERVMGELKRWVWFIWGVMVIFPFYYGVLFPRIENLLYDTLMCRASTTSTSTSKKDCSFDFNDLNDLPIDVTVVYPKQIASFAPEVITVFVNRKKPEDNTIYEISLSQTETSVEKGEPIGRIYHIYLCRDLTNIYQCPEGGRTLSLDPSENMQIGRWYIVYNTPKSNSKEDNNNTKKDGKLLDIILKISGEEGEEGEMVIRIKIASSFEDVLQILIRAFITYMLLPPRANKLLVFLAAFSALFWDNIWSAVRRLISQVKSETQSETGDKTAPLQHGVVGVVVVEIFILILTFILVYICANWPKCGYVVIAAVVTIATMDIAAKHVMSMLKSRIKRSRLKHKGGPNDARYYKDSHT